MYYDYFSNFARRNCAFFSDAVPVHRVVRAVEFKMATGCKFLSLAASVVHSGRHIELDRVRELGTRVWNLMAKTLPTEISHFRGQFESSNDVCTQW